MNKKSIGPQNNKKTRPPIVDGWIELAPGEQVMIDERLAKDWHQYGERIKDLRGRILSVCIQIELMLDSLLRHLFFPEHLLKIDEARAGFKVGDLSVMFLYEIIKDLRFSDKYKIFRKLLAQHKLLEGRDCKELVGCLDRVRKVRNLFAHSAISFVPVGNPPDQILRPEGYSEGKRIILNQKYIVDCEKLFSHTIRLLDTLNREITKVQQNEN